MVRDAQPYDNDIMNIFMKRCQYIHKKMESWEPYGDLSVLVRTTDGRDYLYDELDGYARLIKRFDDPNELIEEEWRIGFSYFLERELMNAGMTGYELADVVGISNVMLSKYLNHKATPSAFVIQRMADCLNCDINDILPHDFIPINHKRKDQEEYNILWQGGRILDESEIAKERRLNEHW